MSPSPLTKQLLEADQDHLHRQGVVPVLTIDLADSTRELLTAIRDGGMKWVEIALRTAESQRAIEIGRESFRGEMKLGAGTVLSPEQYDAMVGLGVSFIVSPGASDKLLDKYDEIFWPFYPGAATVTEVMRLHGRGFRAVKFFPAESSGGVEFLKSVHAILPDMQFMPTGGISDNNLDSYLQLPNVLCVGGSWMAPADLVRQGEWDEIKHRVESTCELVKQIRSTDV